MPALASQRGFRGVEGWRQEEEALLLRSRPKVLIICPMHCPLLILNSKYKILMMYSPVYLRRKSEEKIGLKQPEEGRAASNVMSREKEGSFWI